jgi:hypothetical protein
MLPTIYTAEHDTNPVCGHHLRARCASCGVCTDCDGCYCAELASEYASDLAAEREGQRHVEQHGDAEDPSCYRCRREREESDGYTRCGKCGLIYPDGRDDHWSHNPPYCSPLDPQPTGIDWGYLLGQHVEFVGRDYSVRAVVVADQPVPDRFAYRPHLLIRRTDPGYESDNGPINPREWREIHIMGPAESAPAGTEV